jgi:hypothetical protein
MAWTFTRISPANFAEKVGIPAGWFVISHRWMPSKSQRRVAHGRWYKIAGPGGAIFRILRFSPSLNGSVETKRGEIVIDWPGWLDLLGHAENVDIPAPLEISPASRWKFARLAVSHPDPVYRMAGSLALLSLLLGVLSLILAAWAIYKVYWP